MIIILKINQKNIKYVLNKVYLTMPTNVTIEYLHAEDAYKEAKTNRERLQALEKMLSTVPKHKGTEKLVLQIKRKISKLKKEAERREAKKGGGRGFNIKKEGVTQIALVGPPNVGKSSLLKNLTNANVEIGNYAFTTVELVPGMLKTKDIQIQLVEVPGIIEGISSGKGMGLQLISSIRSADAVVLLVDASDRPCKTLRTILYELEKGGLKINKKRPDIEIKKKTLGGIEIIGAQHIRADIKDVKEILLDFRITSGTVVVGEDVTLSDIQEVLEYSTIYKKGFVAVTKVDKAENIDISGLEKEFKGFDFITVSAKNGKGIENIKEKIYQIADIIRIFTKTPGEKPAYPPVALKKEATVLDVAKKVHKAMVKNFRYARVWGKSVKFGGQRVGEDHILADGDIVEIHMK
ncbi:MAG: OBG GTPase family GTP-binding protein [Candidatus Methanofastidiosia archaeon]